MKFIVVLWAALIFAGTINGQTSSSKPLASPTPAETATPDQTQLRQLTSSVQDLKTQNAVLSKEVDRLSLTVYGLAGVLSFVLLVGTITSFIGWNTDRKRSRETYSLMRTREEEISKRESVLNTRQDTLFNLSLQRDEESTERDRKIFGQSTETLTLVNQTLSLAKEATERASKALEEKLNKKHNELEVEAIELIDESKADKNFKVLVEDSSFRSTLQTLALEITGLQNNQNILEREVLLHPHCSFVRGMDFHLGQHYRPAIKFWKQTKDHPKAPDSLLIMASFWLGYERNNLRYFEEAAEEFEHAASIAKGSLRFELERIRIETRFFYKKKFPVETLLPEMEALYKEVKGVAKSEEFQKVESSIACTLGNMYYQYGNQLSSAGADEESAQCFERAKAVFGEAPKKNKWIWFGYGESCFRLQQYPEASDCFMNKVKPEAEFEYSTRPEPRTKVLGQSTVLICCMKVEALNDSVRTLENLIKTTLGSVDDRVTIYSQFQRRNVLKKEFVNDLNKAMELFDAGSPLWKAPKS